MPNVKLKIDGKIIFVNTTPIEIEICETIAQDIFKFYCNGKLYILRITPYKKLVMTT
jgi:hypothetical protein